MVTNRIKWISILQGWAILWVVIGHAPLLSADTAQPLYAEILCKIAYSFHMPLFVFVSGYLFRMTRIERPIPYGRMIADKLRRLGIPFVVFTIIAMAVKSVFSENMARAATFSVGEFANAVIFPADGPLSELWFVATLLWYFALRPLWEILDSKPVATIIVLAILFYMPEFTEKNLLCYQQVIHYAIFFYLGTIARGKKIFGTPSLRYIAAICTVAIAYPIFIGGGISAALDIIIPVLGIYISILMAKVADKYIPHILSSFRDYSYQIYLMAIFVQIAIKILYRHGFIPYYWLGFALCILLGVYLPVTVSIVVEKTNWKYLKLCIGLK